MRIATFLSFIFVVCVLFAPIVVRADKQTVPEFSVSFRTSSLQNQNHSASKKSFFEQAENGTTTASLIVSRTAVSSSIYDYDKDGYPHKLSIFFDIDADREAKFYAVFYMNEYGDWYTNDNLQSDVYTIENGYAADEGIYIDFYFFKGYPAQTLAIKIEIYREDRSLAYIYGPDDNTEAIPFEGEGYDKKKDPFITTPSPSPTPTPAPTVDEIKLDSSELGDKNRLTLRKGESVKVSAEALSDGEAIPGAEIEAEADDGTGAVTVSPSVATTDENGLAEFTITAKKKGNAKVSFTSGDAKKKILRVKVK